MMRRTGSADLPLHGGRVPAWLATRMSMLGRVITEAIIHHYGRDEWLRRMAHPFWFQSFGAVMGMDWHSSGITTSVIGALKRGLHPLRHELGIFVCGGRGRHSRRTPEELRRIGEQTGLDGDALARTSRLVAKIDSAAVQDGYELYLHGFFVTRDGNWSVVQQGMNAARVEARRYHWLSQGLQSFLDSPHAAIEGRAQGAILNLADARAAHNRQAGLELVSKGPQTTIEVLRRLRDCSSKDSGSQGSLFPESPCIHESRHAAELSRRAAHERSLHLQLPHHHEVRASDVVLRRLHGVLAAAADRGPKDFAELLLSPGLGARTVAALALVAEVVHGAPARFSDPARYSFAHGGKDGQPFPVPLQVYDETIRVLRSAIDHARLGNDDRLHAIRRLDTESRTLEKWSKGPGFAELVRAEQLHSTQRDARRVQAADLGPAQRIFSSL